MKTRYIICALASAAALTACEDYTEHHFGKDNQLWEATQVNNHNIELLDANYADLAANADNVALALAANDDSATYRKLLSVAELKYFRKGISPEEYLPAMLMQLVGTSQYHCMTAGSTINVTCRVATDSLANGAAMVEATSMAAGKYLLIPEGEEQVLAGSGDVSYGYAYLSGSANFPEAVTPLGAEAYAVDEASSKWLWEFVKEDDHYLLLAPNGNYVYLDDTHNSFQYADDLGDLDDGSQAWWNAAANGDGTFAITNVYNGKTILYSPQYKSAGAYAEAAEGMKGIRLYKQGTINIIIDSAPETQTVTFTLGEDGVWAAKSDYLNQALTAMASTDAETIYSIYGWSAENASSLGELTYVWSATTSYGLKASAFKNSIKWPTDAWMISPSMNLKKAKVPLFRFEEAQKYAGTPLSDYLKVYVSTNYAGRGTQASADWTEVTADLQGERSDGSTWDFYPISLDLSAYAGKENVVVAFRYISNDTYAATWEFKNVRCAEATEFETNE